uniref:Rabaptin coiled-coil domain-containing protein n=1 Tax=Ciona savignyi TaxID=51511 RepID=H2YQ51_CIOSA
MDTPGPSNQSNDPTIENQLLQAQAFIAQLKQEKIQMEVDFEYKRGRIKELYFAKESTIQEQNTKLFEAGTHISQLEQELEQLKEESETIKMIASVSENTKQEAVEDLNKHHLEEIESLRCVLQGSMEEQRNDLLRQFDTERRRWEEERSKMEQERDEALTSSNPHEEEQDLEDLELEASMPQAQEEADKLKSVVLPLEKEISDLKAKLLDAQEKLKESLRKPDKDPKHK